MPSSYNRGWMVISAFVLAVMTVALFAIPQQAGLIGGALWLVLIVIPSFGIRQVSALAYQERYQSASQLAQVLSWLHPMDGWRDYPAILGAIALGQQGHLDQAIAILNRYQSPTTVIGRLAAAYRYRLNARWEDLLAWIHEHGLTARLNQDPSLMVSYLRSLGEMGDLNHLVEHAHTFNRILERTGNSQLSNLVRLFVLSYCGDLERVHPLLSQSFADFSPQFREFWLATAEMAADQRSRAEQRLVALKPRSDSMTQWAIARRLKSPLVVARTVLTEASHQTLSQIEQDAQHQARYGRPFTFISKTAYATYLIIALNLMMYGMTEVRGSSLDVDTLTQLGALNPIAVWQGEWWRLLMANFLHLGWLHLTMNMLGLYFLGGFVESTLGIGRYLITYFGSGIGAMFLIVLLAIASNAPDQTLVGASAAIMGLVGAIGAIMIYGWRYEKSRIAAKNLLVLMFVIGIQIVFDLTTPGVSFLGHTLGLILGFVISSLLLRYWKLVNI